MKIFYCTICRYPAEALPVAKRAMPYVDRIIIIHHQYQYPYIERLYPDTRQEFDNLGECYIFEEPWADHFSSYRQKYLQKAKEIAIEKNDDTKNLWILVTDPDEIPSIPMMENLRDMATKADSQGSTMVTFNTHDASWKTKGIYFGLDVFSVIPKLPEDVPEEELSCSIARSSKELFFKYNDRLTYIGDLHTSLSGTGLRFMQAPKEYYYTHIKSDMDIHHNGVRNYFIGGGGVQEHSQKWIELRKITDRYGIDEWIKMDNILLKGNIPKDIKQFFIDHKDDDDSSSDSELRSFYTYYFHLHPDECDIILPEIRQAGRKLDKQAGN